MAETKFSRLWVSLTIVLVVLIITGGVVALVRYSPSRAIEISMPPSERLEGNIYVGGEVSAPGFYPFRPEDSLDTLLQAAGGVTDGANLSDLRLYISAEGQSQEPQKVDINRAEAWLLMALPGVGETLAQHIIDYRRQNGPFRNTAELMKVAGIGPATYQRIKDLITVADY